jgi:O-antigen/teichoic acid export membrane protein
VSVLRRNIIWLFMTQAATWMVSILLLVVAPAKLDPDGFGQLQLATAFVGFFVLIGSLGSSPYIVKEVARDPGVVGPLVHSAIQLKLVLGTILSVLAMALAVAIGYSETIIALIAIGCVGMILALLNEVIAAGLSGLERMAGVAGWQAAQTYLATLAGIAVLMTSGSLLAFAATTALAWMLPVVANYITLRRHVIASKVPPRRRIPWKPMIVGGAPLVALTVLNLIYGTIDIPLLGWVSGAEIVGFYALAYRWVSMPIFIVTIVVTAFFPKMSAMATKDADAFASLTNRALRLVVFITIPASVGMILVSADLLDLLYGDQYDESAKLMQILSIHIPLAAVDTVLATALIAIDQHRRYIYVSAAAAFLNPPLALLAISVTQDRFGNGAIGAAAITVCTELFIMVLAIRMRPKGVIDASTVGFTARCSIAAAAMVVPVVALWDLGLFLKIGAGGATFAAVSLALGTVSAERVRRVAGEFRNRQPAESNDDGSEELSTTGSEP